jgi:PfaD family protein
MRTALLDLARPFWVERDGGSVRLDDPGDGAAFVPPCRPEHLGDRAFLAEHGLRYPCVAGAMANGIGSVDVVEAMGRSGMLGFFGAAGLAPDRVAEAVDRLAALPSEAPWGVNFIHSPSEPDLEEALVDLFHSRGVGLVEASAFLALTPALVRYRVTGLHRDEAGRVVAPNRVVAKVSRVEVASKFLAPAPEKMLTELVAAGRITADEAALAAEVPVASDLTAEADSGGHTDNRPAVALLPTMIALRDRLQAEHGYRDAPRVGLAGGIATPASAAAAFSMGAAWIVTGSVNQSCVEAGTSDGVRAMLADAGQADVTMAPAADMFEMGVEVQVLKRGTMFAMRAKKLHDLYMKYDGLEAIPATERASLEKQWFRTTMDQAWDETRAWWNERDPAQVQRAEADARHRMALVFRSYLGQTSRWANAGVTDRKIDYQVWCGPAMGAFNEWVSGSFLQDWKNRRVALVGLNLLVGAAVHVRAAALRGQGIPVPSAATDLRPMRSEDIQEILERS